MELGHALELLEKLLHSRRYLQPKHAVRGAGITSITQHPSVLLILHFLTSSCWGFMNGKGRWPMCFRLGRIMSLLVIDNGKTLVNSCGRVAAY